MQSSGSIQVQASMETIWAMGSWQNQVHAFNGSFRLFSIVPHSFPDGSV